MENINFSPFKYETYDCYQNNIISIVRYYYDQDYSPVFWSNFDFKYRNLNNDDNDGIKFDNFYLYGSSNLESNILYDICGIKITEHNDFGYKDFKDNIYNKLLQGQPIGICIDSFHLPWNKYYKNVYRCHYILVCGFQDSNNVICYDGYLSEKLHTISMDDLFINYENVMFYENFINKKIGLRKCLSYFKNVILENDTKKFDMMKELACDLKHNEINSFNNYENNDIRLSLFLIGISRVCWSRHNFANSIKYFNNTYNYDISIISSKIQKVSDEWKNIKILLIKAILLKKVNLMKKAGELIEDIALEEKAIASDIGKL